MNSEAFLEEARNLSPEDLKDLVLKLTTTMDEDSSVELESILTSRRRAEEMKNGTAPGLSHEEAFARARKAFAG